MGRLTSTQSELKEVELALTRERRSHEVKQTYFERVIVGYQAKIDELKKLDLQSDELSTLDEPLKRSTAANPMIQLNGQNWDSSSSTSSSFTTTSESDNGDGQRDS